MRQYHAAKRKHPHALLLFRMGDFYELFFEDAKVAAKELGLTLTSRSKERDMPMAGVPVRSYEAYLVRLVRAGYTVAICDQIQDAREAKGIVDRDIVRVVSPGTLLEDENLDGAEPMFVLAVHVGEKDGRMGLAWADLSTGAFRCSASDPLAFVEDLARIGPAEVVLPDRPEFETGEAGAAATAWRAVREAVRAEDLPVTPRARWAFDPATGRRDLLEQLGVATLEAYGIEEMPECLAACGALLGYLRDAQKTALAQLRELVPHRPSRHLVLDRATRRTLEITQAQHDRGRAGTLLQVIDRTGTPMGARRLREWLLEPLVDLPAIEARQGAVAALHADGGLRRSLAAGLDGLGDLERLAGRIASGRAGARDLVGLGRALGRVPALLAALEERTEARLQALRAELDPCSALQERIERTLVEAPPLALQEGGLVRDGFHADLDELRALARGGKDHLAALQAREIERTGIATLKVGFNRVFGYYLEITHANREAVPADYVRKQTLKNAERYITPELKEYESKVLGAEERAQDLEYQVFLALRNAAGAELERLLATAAAIAELDVLVGLATIAVERAYVRPELLPGDGPEGPVLEIVDGRHPVVEAALAGEPFVPNDTRLDASSRLVVLTGPNMSGKSTWLRQTALIVLLAQVGSFVPAGRARLALTDRIFTRLGGGDDISRGASTFMVEMVETANILRHATARSLLLLDEVGRGTSTFDGLAIAWAVCEHVHDVLGARCLFATHYHQLTDLAASLAQARNQNVAVREWGEEIVFLHRIEEGGTDRSYGIHVARLAGVPAAVLERSRAVLARLERDEEGLSRRILASAAAPSVPGPVPHGPVAIQPSLFELLAEADEDLLAEVRGLKLDEVPPIEAWGMLRRIVGTLAKGQAPS